MGHTIAGVHYPEPGDFQYQGLWYPDGDKLTKYMAWRLGQEQFYQHDKLAKSLEHVKRFRGAVDCGAWVGGWSRELARHFERVVAIELSTDNARCCRKNLESCGNAEVVQCGVGDENRKTIAVSAGAGLVGSWVKERRDPKDEWIPLRRLDEVVEVQALPAIDYMKIHVNGYELKVLRGAVQTLARCRPVLTVVLKPALADFGDSVEAALDFLRSIGYREVGGEAPYRVFANA